MATLDSDDLTAISDLIDARLVAAYPIAVNVQQWNGYVVTTGAIPSAAAGSPGGLLIVGTNDVGTPIAIGGLDIGSGAIRLGTTGNWTVDIQPGTLGGVHVLGAASGAVRIDGSFWNALVLENYGGNSLYCLDNSSGGVPGKISGAMAPTLAASFFSVDSGETAGSAVGGSVIAEGGGGGGGMSVADLFADSGLTFADAVAGSPIAEVANHANLKKWLDVAPAALSSAAFVQADAQYIGGAATAVGPLVQWFNGLQFLTVSTAGFTATTTVFELTDASGVDRYTGSILRFLGGPPGKCFTRVVSFAFPAGRARLTVSPALPVAPGNGDVFLHDGLEVGAVTSLAAGVVTDAAFTAPDPDTPATGILGMIQDTFMRFYRRVKNNKVDGTLTTYKSDNTTVKTTQTYTSTPGADDVSAAS